jgi:hypothetical protein
MEREIVFNHREDGMSFETDFSAAMAKNGVAISPQEIPSRAQVGIAVGFPQELGKFLALGCISFINNHL